MELKKLEYDLTICKVSTITDIDMDTDFYFVGKTDEEISLVCKTEDTPKKTTERDDGWKLEGLSHTRRSRLFYDRNIIETVSNPCQE